MKGNLFERAAASLVSRPLVYEIVQTLAGQARVAALLRSALESLGARMGESILDVGSAEGGFAARLGIDPVYVDIDVLPLLALRRRRLGSRAVAADAVELPFSEKSFDAALCAAVSHHLDGAQFEKVVSELARVTRRHLVFVDAVRNDGRAVSRWLWRFDRGRYPRTREALASVLERHFVFGAPETFTVLHQYVVWVASPR